jgi:ubiquitin-protein ligase
MLQPSTVRKIIKELGQLRSDPPEDIRVQVDEEDILQFVGIIAGPGQSAQPQTDPTAVRWFVCA